MEKSKPPEAMTKGLLDSKTTWGVVVLLFMVLAKPILGIDLSQYLSENVEAVGGLTGAALALYGRVRASKPIDGIL